MASSISTVPHVNQLPGVPVVFKDLSYTVQSEKNKKESVRILSGVTGCFAPGEMSALMGASGSGKTTLLDSISGRKTLGDLGGEVLFAGVKPSQPFLQRHTGYVEQFDTLIGVLTVREMLLYTAEMKRSVAEPFEEKQRVVDHFIDVLGLEDCKDTRIGSSMNRGISGGQAKRTNVGLAMVTDPQVLFLDEPTTGLDSHTAKEVMLAVKDVAARGVTVCATIHSPSPFCFALFDRLLVLARGEMAYHGPNGAEMLHYFQHGCGVPLSESMLSRHADTLGLQATASTLQGLNTPGAGGKANLAEFLTDLVVGAQREKRSQEYVHAYQVLASVERAKAQATVSDTSGGGAATPMWNGIAQLVKYRSVRNHRDPEWLLQRFSDKLIFSVLMATLYRGIGSDLVLANYVNISSVLVMWTIMPAFTATSFMPEIVLERPLYVRERADGLYRPITYLLAKIVDELLLLLVSSVVFSALVFYVIELPGSFLVFWGTYLVTLSTGLLLGYLVAALSPTMDFANAALPTYVTCLLFFSGFTLRFGDMPGYWKWFSYTNFIRYCWTAHMVNVFEGLKDDDGSVPTIGGQPVLEYYSLEGESIGANVGYGSLFIILFFFATWATFQFRTFAKR